MIIEDGTKYRKLVNKKEALDKLCMDLTAAYYVELNSAKFEVVHLLHTSNANELLENNRYTDFNQFSQKYASTFLEDCKRREVTLRN